MSKEVGSMLLSELLEKKIITPSQAELIATQLFEALDGMREEGIVHGQIKTDAIIVNESYGIHLIDPKGEEDKESGFLADLHAVGRIIEEIAQKADCPPRSAIVKAARKCKEFGPNQKYDSARGILLDIRTRRWLNYAFLIIIAGAAIVSAVMYFV